MTKTTMQTITIRHRLANAVLWTGNAANLRDAAERAVKAGADLSGADLRYADLRCAGLSGADLSRADLRCADLSGADFRCTDLSRADLTPIRDDFWAMLSAQPSEVEGLRAAIAEGRIDGSTYYGSCACLVGTIANVARVKYNALPVLKPDSTRPAERFFLGILKGDTPETNPLSKLALKWADLWLANVKAAFAK